MAQVPADGEPIPATAEPPAGASDPDAADPDAADPDEVRATPPPAAVSAGVAFDTIDQAAVRVFAVRHVGVETVQGERVRRMIALPQAGHGTGFVIDPRGVVVTAKHVVDDMRHIAVRLPGPEGAVLPAIVAYADDHLDFAILLVKVARQLPHVVPLPDEARMLHVRDTVDAIGYPLDADRNQPQSSRGIISGALNDGSLQLDIAVNPGNSGGPLLDQQGALVGVVVARGDPRAGVQGIGVAVPIGPVREAFDRARRGGALSRALRALNVDVSQRQATAEVVDGIVRLGGAELLIEAADFGEDSATTERIDAFRRMAEQTEDPDLLALIAAYFWDAAQIMIEHAGGLENPSLMPAGPARVMARRLWRDAHALAAKALRVDGTIVERSPFIAELTGERPSSTSSTVSPGGLSVKRIEGQPPYRPWVLASSVVGLGPEIPGAFGSRDRAIAGGMRLALFLPFTRYASHGAVRISPIVGASFDALFSWDPSCCTYFAGAEIGLALAIGWPVGVTLHASWSPGVYTMPDFAPDCFDRGIHDECPALRAGTARLFHASFTIKIFTFNIGVSIRAGRAHGSNPIYPMRWIGAPTIGGSF